MGRTPVRVLIIGAGKMAKAHAAALQALPTAEIVAVASRTGTTAEALASLFEGCQAGDDWRSLAERTKPDACVVAVTHSQNESITRQALETGLHVLAEKPVAFSSDAVEALATVAEANGVVAMAAMNRRYYTNVLDAIESVRLLGGLVGVTLFAPDPVRSRRASGTHDSFVFDLWTIAQTLHAIDLLRLAAGEAPASFPVHRSLAVGESNVTAMYRSEAGVLVTFIAHSTAGGTWELRLHGAGCEAVLRPLEAGDFRIQGSTATRPLVTSPRPGMKEGVLEQAAAFVDAVASGRLSWPASSLADHARSVRLAEQLGGQDQRDPAASTGRPVAHDEQLTGT